MRTPSGNPMRQTPLPRIRARCPHACIRPTITRRIKRGTLGKINRQPCANLLLQTKTDCAPYERRGTSKKFEPGVEACAVANHDDVAATLKGARVEDRGRANRIDPGRLVNVPRDTNVGADFLDEPARRRTADGLAARQAITFGFNRRRMTDHEERPLIAHCVIAAPQRVIDFSLAELAGRSERRDIRAAATEDADPADDDAAAVERDLFSFKPGKNFGLVKIAGHREHLRTAAP